MAFNAIPLPEAWDIPLAAGISGITNVSIKRGTSAVTSVVIGDAIEDWTVKQRALRWGLWDKNNRPFATTAHVLSLEFGENYSISTAPITEGSFASYNKVKSPYSAVISFICDGTERGVNDMTNMVSAVISIAGGDAVHVRSDFVTSLQKAAASTDLFSIITPEKTYLNANITGYRFRRSSSGGVNMIVADVMVTEVRNDGSLSYSRTREPMGAKPTVNGTVQAQKIPSEANVSKVNNTVDSTSTGDGLSLETIYRNLPKG